MSSHPAASSPRLLMAYGAIGLPAAMLLLPLYVHLPTLYASEMGLGLATVGAVLLAARIWDVAIDPAIGWLSDATPGRFGRRKPWLFAGLPLAMAGALALFLPPSGAGAVHLLIWTMILYLGAAMIQIPYTAWGAELSGDYHERTRIAGWREGFVVLGTVVAAALPAALGGKPAEGVRLLGIVIAVLLPLTVLAAIWLVPEPPRTALPAATPLDRRALRALWRNGPFRRLLLAWLLNGVANGLPATLVLLFVEHVIQRPDLTGPALLIYFAAGVVAVPVWLRLAKRHGKHRVWIGAMLWACALFALVPLLGPGDGAWFLALCVATGLSLGADLALPPAMQADVIDVDEARTRRQRAGLFFALWGMATKLALAGAVGLAFPLLDLFGFSPAGGNGAGALFGLAALYSLVPVAFKLAAIGLMWGYPLTETRQRRLRARIERRKGVAAPAEAG